MDREKIKENAPKDATGYCFISGHLFYVCDRDEERFSYCEIYPHWQKVEKYEIEIKPL